MIKAAGKKPTYLELQAENDSLQAKVLSLTHELDVIRRLIFGPKRERFVPAISEAQLGLMLDELTRLPVSEKTEEVTYSRRKKTDKKQVPHGRNPLPASLPRNEIIIEPKEDTAEMKKIGEVITEELEYEPGKLFVNCYIRPKYVRLDELLLEEVLSQPQATSKTLLAEELPEQTQSPEISAAKELTEQAQSPEISTAGELQEPAQLPPVSAVPLVKTPSLLVLGEQSPIIIGNLPSRPIEKGIAGPGLLAHVLISKFVDHLPLYRQNQQFKRQGVEIALSTMSDWVKGCCDLLEPMYQTLAQQVVCLDYLNADETPLRVLDRTKKGTTHLGYIWVYYSPLQRLALFDYRKGRSSTGPNQILKNFQGYLQTDGYQGYNDIRRRSGVISVGCMAHARRKFFEARPADAERAEWMLTKIKSLYRFESQAREKKLTPEQRYDLRVKCARPILDEIKFWLKENGIQVLPKSAMGKAIAYMLNQWTRLERYTEDGRLEIDNNLVENQIRPVALGRKNYLFAGSHAGARRAAIIYSLLATAKQHQVEPFAWLRDVLSRIADHPYKKLAELLPHNWKPLTK